MRSCKDAFGMSTSSAHRIGWELKARLFLELFSHDKVLQLRAAVWVYELISEAYGRKIEFHTRKKQN